MPKYLFLDWSGDVGFKFGRGSSVNRLEGKRDYLAELEEHLHVWHYQPK